ncbi:MAG: polysaccharide biosynthesis tyrosine autokinase [Acidobacteria bacterium]|nr:polysaccharide biosynthesis tyrosine autokinase [Acidobacteriota bacterium]
MENEQNPNQSLIRAQDASRLPGYYYPPPESLGYGHPMEEEEGINLLDYWRVLVKRRWTILTFTFVILAITAIATWKATPVYRSVIKIQIDPEQSNVLPFKGADEIGSNYAQSQEYLQTQFKVLESERLVERVIRVLDLDKNPKFLEEAQPAAKSKTGQWLRDTFGLGEKENESDDPAAVEANRLAILVKYFKENLSASPIRNSRLVDVYYTSHDAQLAAGIANTLAEEYKQMNFETKFDSTTEASEFLKKQLIDLKAKVEKSEEDLVKFSQQHDIYEIGDKQNVILQKLSDLNTALTAAQAERIQKESVHRIVQQAGPGNFPDILRNKLIEGLETNLADLKVQQAKLAAAFKPGWPELDQVTGQVLEAEAQLAAERKKAIRNAETEYRTAIQREKLLDDALTAQKIEANTFNQNSIQYNIIKRQVDTEKQLYDGLLQRMKEAGVSAGLKSNNIHVVDVAKPPRIPYKPKKVLNLALGLMAGLILGVGLAFFIEHLDSSVKTPDDIDRYIKLPALGMIPAMASLLPSSKRKQLAAMAGGNGNKTVSGMQAVELITYHDTKSLISEAYRNLRTSVLLSSGSGRPPKTLLVTSSQAGEGKTTTAVNIAITLSQTGERVILLDCDMRNPRVHKVIGLENNHGMSTFLSGNSDLSSMIQQSDIPNLFAVSAGRVPPNPAELLGSPRMKQGLALLDEYFDHVVIDSPPVLSVTDARIISTLVDGVVLVIKGSETPKEAVQRTKRLLQEVHAHIIGTLLNNVNVRSADYYYYSKYYYYGYGKKYGYGYGYGVKPDQKDDAIHENQ